MKMCLCVQAEEKEDEEEEALVGEVKASPNADTTILFVKGEGDGSFKELATAKNPTCERLSKLKCDLVSLQTFQPTTSSSFCSASPTRDRRILSWSLWTPRSVTLRYGSFPSQAQRCACAVLTWILFGPLQDYQFYIQNFTALQLGTVVPSGRQATFEYSFIPAEPMGGRPFGLVINLNYKDSSVRRRGVVVGGRDDCRSL